MTTRRSQRQPLQTGLTNQVSQSLTLGTRQVIGLNKKRKEQNVFQESKKAKRAAFGDITNKENLKNDKGKDVKKAGVKRKSNVVLVVPKKSTSNSSSQPEKDVSWEIIEVSQGSQPVPGSHDSCSFQSSSSSDTERSSQDSDMDAEKTTSLNWEDIDSENLKDPYQVADYVHEIFQYYKQRESQFVVTDYLPKQVDLSVSMRAVLVDWLVEVQEGFELNHETLYLAVKLVDHYLCKNPVRKDKLQLVGAASLFIACKFDERCPPVIDDFLFICDDAYSREELLSMEQIVLKTLGFDLGIPLSYRFLRRYAKCARASMEILTLARFILESSLMDYKMTLVTDSQLAAATLLLARKMKKNDEWNDTMIYYTGYTAEDLLPLVRYLNTMISTPQHKQLSSIKTKYSHKVFHEVAKIPPLDIMELAGSPFSSPQKS